MTAAERQMPPGWSYNPSSWAQRLPIVGLALIGFAVAGYLSLYRWRVVPTVWEPFFGDGSVRILNSSVSRILPIPDAALGAVSILLVILQPVLFDAWCTLCLASAAINSTVVGVLLIILAFVRGEITQRFGGGWASLWPGAESKG